MRGTAQPRVPRIHRDLGGRWWAPVAVCAGLAAGVLATRYGMISMLLAAAALVVAMSVWRPAWVLFGGLFLELVDASLFPIAAGAAPVLMVGGLTASLMLAAGSASRSTFKLAVPYVALLLILSIGVLTSGNLVSLSSLVVIIAALVLAIRVADHPSDWRFAGAVLAFCFAGSSLLLGETDPTGLRWSGISGNPNRMVFGLLAAIGLGVWLSRRREAPWLFRGLGVAAVIAAVAGIQMSGSSQGVVGLAALGVMAAAGWATGQGRAGRRAAAVVLLVAVVALGFVFLSTSATRLSPDLQSLSGRSAIFEAGYRQFAQAPFLGSGQFRVTELASGDRSSHNSLLGIAIAGGLVCLALWVVILFGSLRAGLARISTGDWSGLCAMGVFTTQLVQQVELLAMTWVLLFLVAGRRERPPRDPGCPPVDAAEAVAGVSARGSRSPRFQAGAVARPVRDRAVS